MSNRDFLYIQPLGTSRRFSMLELDRLHPLPAGAERLAEHDNYGHFDAPESGWLIRLSSGSYAIYTLSGSIRNVNQRKAARAIAAMEKGHGGANVSEELATMCKAWREKADLPASRAAQLLGIPVRTYEGIEQGRGFRYPALLALAIQAFNSTPD